MGKGKIIKLYPDKFSMEDFVKERNKVDNLTWKLYEKCLSRADIYEEDIREIIRHLRYLADKLEYNINNAF